MNLHPVVSKMCWTSTRQSRKTLESLFRQAERAFKEMKGIEGRNERMKQEVFKLWKNLDTEAVIQEIKTMRYFLSAA